MSHDVLCPYCFKRSLPVVGEWKGGKTLYAVCCDACRHTVKGLSKLDRCIGRIAEGETLIRRDSTQKCRRCGGYGGEIVAENLDRDSKLNFKTCDVCNGCGVVEGDTDDTSGGYGEGELR